MADTPEVLNPAGSGFKGRGQSRLDKALKATRLLCVMAAFAFFSFALVDLYMVETSVAPLYVVRCVLIVLCLFIFWFSNRPAMKPHAYKSGAAICIVTGVGVVLLTEMTGGSESLYWTMLMLTFFTASLIMPFRPLEAGAVFVVIALFYDVWLLLTGGAEDSMSWVLSNAGIWLSIVVSVLAVFYIDDLRDREDSDRERLQSLNAQLRDEIVEREKAESVLRRTQQLDAVGRLAAGVAHELNNVLLVISSSAELIQRRSGASDKYADRILQSAQRGARLTSDMLLFARKGHREEEPFSLNHVVAEVAEMVASTQKEASKAKVHVELAPEQPCVLGDSQLIAQALLNLCLNGVDAMDATGELRIRTELRADNVVLIVTDDGKGMAAQELERAFEPFFTTKPPGKGTGLGLSMVYGTITAHQGTVSLESGPGEGTTVTIELPTTNEELLAVRESEKLTDVKLEGASVLLVDDDEMVRRSILEMLDESGCTVTQASNGVEACARLAEQEFALIILDLVMPEMGGREAYEVIRSKGADQRVLIYSGNSPDAHIAQLLKDPYTRFLQKPFRQAELLQAVKSLAPE